MILLFTWVGLFLSTGKLSFWMILAYFLDANLDSSLDFVPVHTIFPELKMRAVVLGSRIRIITAANRLGLYSALRACNANLLQVQLASQIDGRNNVPTNFI
jgi:hypothetical protein